MAATVTGTVLEHGPATTVTASYTDPDSGDTHSFTIDTSTDLTKGKVSMSSLSAHDRKSKA